MSNNLASVSPANIERFFFFFFFFFCPFTVYWLFNVSSCNIHLLHVLYKIIQKIKTILIEKAKTSE